MFTPTFDFIPFEDLAIGTAYKLHARNLSVGIWNGITFIGIRLKFSDRFLDECEVPGSTAWAIEKLVKCPIDISHNLGTLCYLHKRPAEYKNWETPEIKFANRRQPDGYEYEGRWVHADDGSLMDLNDDHAYYVSNTALFDWLDELEKKNA